MLVTHNLVTPLLAALRQPQTCNNLETLGQPIMFNLGLQSFYVKNVKTWIAILYGTVSNFSSNP